MFIHVFPQTDTFPASHMPVPRLHRLTRSQDNPDWTHPLHAHQDYVELMFLASGKAEIKVDQHTFHCSEGDMILLDKNIVHATSSARGSIRDTWCCLLSQVELPAISAGDNYILRCNAGEYFQYVQNTFLNIYEFSRHNTLITDPVCNQLIATLLLIFQEKLKESRTLEKAGPLTFAQQVLKYINSHFAEKITLDSLAKEFFVSKSYLGNEFRKEYDISPINYLIDKRLTESIWLMLNTDTPIHQIAQAVGYDNPYYFSKIFTARMGISPADYREQFYRG